MSFNLDVPTISGEPFSIEFGQGRILFLLGANGTGKSNLMHHFSLASTSNKRFIWAHRQNWLRSGELQMSASEKRGYESNIRNYDQNSESRWRDDYSSQRTSMNLNYLVDAENHRAREIAKAADQNDECLVRELAREGGPLKIINELLRLSNIPISLFIEEGDRVVASRMGGPPYSVAELSDGERNALFIATNVLTAPSSALILIDEPERHLHRSIIAPLLTQLFFIRDDCAFIISTHDIEMPLHNVCSDVLLVRGCIYSQSGPPIRWDVDLISSTDELSDSVKRDILGSRKKVLFIEGEESSLDKPLYSLVFPGVSIIAKASCRDVAHAVDGIREANHLHWVHAFGIVDNDRRVQSDVDGLKARGIYALPTYSVESIYYHPEVQARMARRQASFMGDDAEANLAQAKSVILREVATSAQNLVVRAVEKTVREQVFMQLPTRRSIEQGRDVEISINIASTVGEESARLNSLIQRGDITAIITQYPVRQSGALSKAATALGFRDRKQYESAVRKMVADDHEALILVKSLFGTLPDDLNML